MTTDIPITFSERPIPDKVRTALELLIEDQEEYPEHAQCDVRVWQASQLLCHELATHKRDAINLYMGLFLIAFAMALIAFAR